MDTLNIKKAARKLGIVLLHPHFHAWNIFTNRCPICRQNTVYVCDEPADRWIRRCIWCRSTPKYRAISLLAERHTGRPLEMVLQCGGAIYELSTTSPLFRKLHGRSGYTASGYFSDKPFGLELRPGVWNQDLQGLSFRSETFDLVISSETMEHVRKPWDGFKEIWRVLRPGGAHVFTIPYREDRFCTARVDTSGPENRYILPPVYHRDPYKKEDSLVYTDFGRDLASILSGIGFNVELVRMIDRVADIQDDQAPVLVFLAQKPSK